MKAAKSKLDKAKFALQNTLKRILEINKKRKELSFTKKTPELYLKMKNELKILNKVAETQAILVQIYESQGGDKKTG